MRKGIIAPKIAGKKNFFALAGSFFVDNSVWKMWITFYLRRSSPIFTTSPAPIVINKSPGAQCDLRKSSISLKEEK